MRMARPKFLHRVRVLELITAYAVCANEAEKWDFHPVTLHVCAGICREVLAVKGLGVKVIILHL